MKQISFEEATAFLQLYIDALFELHFTFDGIYFKGEKHSWEGGKIMVGLDVLFTTLEEFLQDLKNEFKIFN